MEGSREARREKTSHHVHLCEFRTAIVCVYVRLCAVVFFPSSVFSPPFLFVVVVVLTLSVSFFFSQRKKAFKGAIVQSGSSGLLVSGQQSNTTNMAGTNQGPG